MLQVSEAALYRHFASKAQMFEGLIEFIEKSVFSLVNQIVEREQDDAVVSRVPPTSTPEMPPEVNWVEGASSSPSSSVSVHQATALGPSSRLPGRLSWLSVPARKPS